jgi:hypothetical protein
MVRVGSELANRGEDTFAYRWVESRYVFFGAPLVADGPVAPVMQQRVLVLFLYERECSLGLRFAELVHELVQALLGRHAAKLAPRSALPVPVTPLSGKL